MNELNLLEEAIAALGNELDISVIASPARPEYRDSTDGFVELGAPINQRLAITAWPSSSKPVAFIAKRLKRYPAGTVLVTDHLSEKKAKALRAHGVEFFDMAGNAYLNRADLHIWVSGHKYPFWGRLEKVDSRAAFERSGLKVTFGLLTQPGLVDAPYRQIAESTGVALGTVTRVMDSLKQLGYLLESSAQRHLTINKALLDNWAQAYITKLMPKLDLGDFTAGKEVTDQVLKALDGLACWGGEIAAEHYTGYLKPKVRTLYIVQDEHHQVMNQLRLRRPSPFNKDNAGGLLQLRTQFWPPQADSIHAPPLVIYADLLATADVRKAETAEVIYERYLEPLCQ